MGPRPGDRSAIVVGAGVAGLIAAQTLKNASFNVTVLEARQRIGGRIWSESLTPNITVDAGAAWLEGIKKNPLAQLATSAGIPTRRTSWDNFLTVTSSGSPVNPSDLEKAEELYSDFLDWAEASNTDGKFSKKTTLEAALQAFLKSKPQNISPAVLQTLQWKLAFELEEEYAAPLSALSAMYYDSDSRFSGDYMMFPGGYSQVMNVLAAGLDIRLGDPVVSVSMANDSITVSTSSGKSFKASYVVCTLPLGLLKAGTVRFDPPLPAAKQAAIQQLGYGLLDKIVMLFQDKFWDDDSLDGFGQVNGIPGSPWPSLLFVDRVVDAPVVVAFNFGDQARRLENSSDAQAIAEAMAVIRSAFGSDVPDPIAHLITRWEADPFSRGSYSFIAAGATPGDFDALARPVESASGNSMLVFAGEATSRSRPGTAPGAFLSGKQAAQRIIAHEQSI